MTVGAIEQPRNITNQVTRSCAECDTCTNITEWLPSTDSSNQVAGFSGRGNVAIGIEGDSGRFKPDVVAPGISPISTRSANWDHAAYYNPTNDEGFVVSRARGNQRSLCGQFLRFAQRRAGDDLAGCQRRFAKSLPQHADLRRAR